jgi:transposase
MTPKELSDIRRKLKVLNYAKEIGNAAAACRHFGVSGESFYKWKRAYERGGERALINSKPCPQTPKLRTPAHIEEIILYLRRTYYLGQQPIAWYLLRYHDDIKISPGAVRNVLVRNGLHCLPQNAKRSKRVQLWQRYEKKVPDHHIQVFERRGPRLRLFAQLLEVGELAQQVGPAQGVAAARVMGVGEPAVVDARAAVRWRDVDLIDGRFTAPHVRGIVRQPRTARHVHVGELPLDSEPRLVGVDDG